MPARLGASAKHIMGEMKKLSYAARRFSDEDLEALPMKEATYPYEEVDFSQNSLSVDGLRKVLNLCSRCEKLRILKLYKNDINDVGAKELGQFLRNCSTLEELHLSHNHFTAEGVNDIVEAAQEARKDKDSMPPLWCRLEMNDVGHPDKVLKDIERVSDGQVLGVEGRTRYQVQSARNAAKSCKVHLPHFCCQKGFEPKKGKGNDKGKGKGRGDRWEGDWKDDRWDDSWDRKRKWSDRDESGRDGWDRSERGRDSWNDNRKDNRNDGQARRTRERKDDSPPPRQPPPRRQVRAPSPEPAEPRPDSKVKIGGGIFLRAMGAALAGKKTKAVKDEEEDVATRSEAPAEPQKANVSSAILGRLGMTKKKKKVKLTQNKRVKAEGEEASGEDEEEAESDVELVDEGSAAASDAEAASESEAEKPEAEAEASSAKGSDAESEEAKPAAAGQRRPASPPARPARQSPARRGGASPQLRGGPRRRSPPRQDLRNDRYRRDGPDRFARSPRRGAPRGREDRPRRAADADRRGGGRGPRRRDDSRGGGGRGGPGLRRGSDGRRGDIDDRSRSPRRARRVGGRDVVREEGRRTRRNVDAGGEPGERRAVRGTRGAARSPADDASLSPPVRRAADPERAARAAATARAERLVEDLPVQERKPRKKIEEEPVEAKVPVEAARPKGQARPRAPRTQMPASPPASREAPPRAPAARAPAAAPAAAKPARAKAAAAKAPGQAGSESEYSYTDESEYTEETVSEDEAAQPKARARPAAPARSA